MKESNSKKKLRFHHSFLETKDFDVLLILSIGYCFLHINSRRESNSRSKTEEISSQNTVLSLHFFRINNFHVPSITSSQNPYHFLRVNSPQICSYLYQTTTLCPLPPSISPTPHKSLAREGQDSPKKSMFPQITPVE